MPPARTRLIVPLTQPDPAAMRLAMAQAVAASADAVEVRLDFLADPHPSDDTLRALLADAPCPVLLTCRCQAEGGQFAGAEADRIALLARAARFGGDWLDIELAALDHAGPLLAVARTPSPRTGAPRELIVSAHDFQRRPDLAAILARMEAGPGTVNKIAFAAAGPEDAWHAFDALRASQKPAIVLAMGEAGLPSRILAGKFGAFATFASLAAGAESAPGQPTIDQLRRLYRWADIGPDTRVYGVIGCPVGHSMSPAIHNAAFAAVGLDAVYVPLRIEPGAEPFNRFLDAVLARPASHLAGLSVTIPHKENALARVGPDHVDALSRAIGAVNTIRLTGEPDRPLEGFNTDYAAAIDALVEAMDTTREDLAGQRVAVLGAGGAARALVAALSHYRARTAIYNRTPERAEQLAAEFSTPAGPVTAHALNALAEADAEIVINTTSVGMHPHTAACPLPETFDLRLGQTVFDMVYNPIETVLLTRARAAGARTVSGVEMFVNQAVRQFELWTHRQAPRDVMRRVVLDRLSC